MNCIIVDDEAYATDTLKDYISKTAGLTLLNVFNSPTEALKEIENGLVPDLAFLDIDMPNLSGLDMANLLPKSTAIVFVSAHQQFALKAFETYAYDYILKPVPYSRFLNSIKKIKSMLETKHQFAPVDDDYFFVNPGVKGKLIKVKFSEITYIKGLKNFVVIYFTGGKQVTYLTMHEIEERLPSSIFIRIQKSFIININFLACIEGNSIIIAEQVRLPLGEHYKEKLLSIVKEKTVISKR